VTALAKVMPFSMVAHVRAAPQVSGFAPARGRWCAKSKGIKDAKERAIMEVMCAMTFGLILLVVLTKRETNKEPTQLDASRVLIQWHSDASLYVSP
jgi:hypothetical protein